MVAGVRVCERTRACGRVDVRAYTCAWLPGSPPHLLTQHEAFVASCKGTLFSSHLDFPVLDLRAGFEDLNHLGRGKTLAGVLVFALRGVLVI